MHPAHPLAVAFGEVVVDRDDVHTLAGERVEVGRQHTRQGLSLAGLHLGDVAEVQCRTAHHLNVEVPLLQDPPGRLAGHGEGLGQQLIELLPVGHPLAELVGLGTQLGVGELLDVVGEGVDVVGDPAEALHHAPFTEAQQLGQHGYIPCGLEA